MTFVDNVSVAVDRLGTNPIGIILGLGHADWPDDTSRDAFLDTVVGGK